MSIRRLLVFLPILVLIVGLAVYLNIGKNKASLSSFEECATSGYLVVRKNVNSCYGPTREIFVEEGEEFLLRI